MTNQAMKLFSATLGATLLAAAAIAQTNASAPAKAADKLAELFGDPVIAKGKGVEVKRSQLDAIINGAKAQIAASGQAVSPERMALLERQVLEGLINDQLVLSKATDADKTKGRENFEKSLAKLKTDANLSDAEFNAKLNLQLRAQGLTREQWDKQRSDQSIIQTVLERELKTSVSDADAQKYYDENPARFEQPEMVHANHILLSTMDLAARAPLSDEQQKAKRKQMEDILKRAKAGEDFVKLAKEFSDDPSAKEKGGEILIARMQTGLPEFEAAAFSLNTNQISDIITTQLGYHLIKLIERIPAKKVELAKVADDVKDALKVQQIQKQMPDYLAQLKKEAAVEILDEKLKALDAPGIVPAEPAAPAKAAEKSAPAKK